MLIETSQQRMKQSFESVLYSFKAIPERTINPYYGIYFHIPFCHSFCSFCPFYKVKYHPELKDAYVKALCRDIQKNPPNGKPEWIYFGGGTPNTLTIQDLRTIIELLRENLEMGEMGIELQPNLLTVPYLKDLKHLGFTKISLGVESLSPPSLIQANRKDPGSSHIYQLIETAQDLGFWINTDLLLGLPEQTKESVHRDVAELGKQAVQQITIYPFMTLRGMEPAKESSILDPFAIIDTAGEVLDTSIYHRKSIWTYAQGDRLYDTSRDELTSDYIGFGATAFSTYGEWKVVNPEVKGYIYNTQQEQPMGFVAKKSRDTDSWRKFAQHLYDLSISDYKPDHFFLKAYTFILARAGYFTKTTMSEKGRKLAHSLTKTVVESLPFPVQNPSCVDNYSTYQAFIADLT